MTAFSYQPATGTDDGQSGSGSGYSTSSSPQLGGYYGTAQAWIRVLSDIPAGATINTCTISGNRISSAGTADLRFKFVKEDDPSYPTSGGDFDGRTLTTAYVDASYSGTGAWTSADLSTPLQELIDAGYGTNGKHFMLFILDNNSNANHGGFENRIQIRSYDYGSDIPTIAGTYTEAAAGNRRRRSIICGA